MYKHLKEYVDFSAKVNDYIATIMIDAGISCEEYYYSSVWEQVGSQGVMIRGFPFNKIANEQIAGLLIHDQLESTIGFNQELDEKSKNFVISHEIIHYLFHMDDRSQLFVDTTKNMQQWKLQALHEFQANIGASIILVPDSVLLSALKKGWPIAHISNTFGLSEEALIIRLIQMMQANLGYSFESAKSHANILYYGFNDERRAATAQLAIALEMQLKKPKRFIQVL